MHMFFGEVSVQVQFLNCVVFLLLSFQGSLHILDKSPLLDVLYKYFLLFVAYIFNLGTMYFKKQKILILMKSSLPILFSQIVSLALYVKYHHQFHLNFLILSSRSFVVLYFTFRSVIQFELIFMKDLKFVSRFIFYSLLNCRSFYMAQNFYHQCQIFPNNFQQQFI